MALKIQLTHDAPSSANGDALVLCLSQKTQGEDAHLAGVDAVLGGALSRHLEDVDFRAERGSAIVVPTLGRLPQKNVIVVGVRGTDPGDVAVTEAVAMGVRTCLGVRAGRVVVSAPAGSSLRAVGLGARLGAYTFERYQAEPKAKALVSLVVLLDHAPTPDDKKAVALGERIAEGVCLARDLVNEPPNELTPLVFAAHARKVAERSKLGCKILEGDAILKAGMLLHHAVGRGSSNPSTFIHLTYKPKNAVGRIVFVGKGLTFDTGGICIKPMQGMAEMKSDMAGGAAVLGMMDAIAALGPAVEVHGIIGAAENMPDGDAYRPADVIGSLSGKTVEIINTDAEGRLVLADALTYAARLDPDLIVDAATLTGATLISLGPSYSAFFTESEAIAGAMKDAAQKAGENFWRMPLVEELKAELESDVADLKHVGERYGGAITAALFLREFTDKRPWMHCDIPGPVLRSRASGMHPKGGTGHAVLTFLELAARHAEARIVTAERPAVERVQRSKKTGSPAAESKPASPSRRAVAKPRGAAPAEKARPSAAKKRS